MGKNVKTRIGKIIKVSIPISVVDSVSLIVYNGAHLNRGFSASREGVRKQCLTQSPWPVKGEQAKPRSPVS